MPGYVNTLHPSHNPHQMDYMHNEPSSAEKRQSHPDMRFIINHQVSCAQPSLYNSSCST